MPADAQIRITAENQTPQAFRQVDQSLKSLDQQTRAVQSSTRQSAAALGLLDDEAKQAAVGVTSLGRSIFSSSAEAKKFGGVYRSIDGRLRETNGRFVKGKEAVEGLTRGFGGASRGAGILTNSLGSLGGVIGALGIAAVSHQLVQFAQGSVRAAGRLELLTTGLANVEGSSIAAEQRLQELDAIARLPGANLESLIRYSARLQAAGVAAAEVDSILKNTGQAIVVMGGNAALADQALEQLSQSIEKNVIVMQDLRPIIQRIPGFLQAIGDAHGVAPTLDGLREASDRLGGSVKDALLPVLERLGERFAAPPPESYVRSVDELQNSFFLFQATLGNLVLPSVAATARGLAGFFDATRLFITGANEARDALNAFNAVLRESDTLLESSDAIQTRIRFLETLIERLEETRRNLGIFDTRGRAGVASEIARAESELGGLQGVSAGSPERLAELNRELENLNNSLANVQGRQTDLENTASRFSENQQRRFAIRRENLEEEELGIIAQIEKTESLRDTTAAAFKGTLAALRQDETAKDRNAAVTAILATNTAAVVQASKELAPPIISAEEAFADLTAVLDSVNLGYNDFQSRIQSAALAVAGFTGEIEGVQEPFTAYTALIHASNAALEEEAKTLATVTQRIIQQTQDAEALVHIQEVLTQRTDAHNAALVNPIVTEATQRIRAYATALDSTQFSTQALTEITSGSMDRIQEFTDAVLTSEGVLNNFAPALGEVETRYIGLESVTDRLTASIRDQASAFDELRRSVESFDQSESQRREQRGIQTPRLPGETITPDRALGDLDRLFGTDPRSREQDREAAEAQREAIQIYNDLSVATVDFTSSLIDLQGGTNLADRAFQDFLGTFERLAAGDFTAILDIPIQLLNISRQAAAERQQGAQARAALYEEQFGEFERFGRNFGTVSEILGIPDSSELSDSLFFTPAQEFENVIAQSTADFSDGIKNALLSSVINLERDIRPEDIAEIFQSGIDRLGESLALSQFNLNFDEQLGRDTADAYNALISDTTAFYQAQIDVINLVRQTTGNLSFGDPEALARASQAATNQARLQLADGPQNAQQFLAQTGRTRGLAPGQDDQERGVVADPEEAERVAAEALANVIEGINDDVALINTAIAGFDNAISQSNDPAEIEQILQQIAIQIPERYRLLRDALQRQLDAGDITQESFDTSIAQLGIEESAELERNSDEMLANALLINRQAIEAINVQVAGLENAISQSNDPAEIANLLLQIAQQIPEIYRLRRNALSEQYAAGEITLQSFNTSIAQLNIEQSAALEQNSDQRLANTLLINQQQTEAVSSVISELENRISQSNDPAEIATLLQQIAEQIPEIYRLRRNALSAQFAAGEITLSAINTGIAALNIEESAALEQNSDAKLANTLRINQEAQTAISTEISALEQAIATSNDPVEIVALLMQIAEQIPEKYRLKREALQAQYDANEITIGQLRDGLLQLDTAEAAEIERNSDAQLANALTDHNADIQLIANNINALSDDIRNSDDPAEIAQLLVDLRAAIMEKFRLQREFLQKRLDAEEITIKQHKAQLGSLDIQEGRQLGGADSLAETETQGITRAAQRAAQPVFRGAGGGQRTVDPAQAAQRAADEALATALSANQDAQNTITVEISRLENVISTSNDPAEIESLLQQIAEQIPEIYRLRREALQTQFDAGKLTQAALENGIASLGIEQSAALEQNSDAMLANALLLNQQVVAAINTEISGIENAISQSNDPAEIATLLQQIAEQIPEIYRLRREALQSQYDEGEITLQALQTGLAQLGIEESAALEQNSDAMLANALRINQHAAEAVNTHIAGLENRISQSNDPVEIATLLQQIAVQIPEIYRLRREALQKQFDEGEITLSTLQTGLAQANIDESAALERNSDQRLANTLGVLNTDAQLVNNEITSLSEQIRTSNDPVEIASLVVDLQAAVMEKYRLQREVLQKQLDAEELTIRDFNAQLGSINLAETSELTSAAALGGAETDDLRRTSNALLQNAIQRAQFNLTGATGEQDFETRRQELLRFINEYYDAEKARIDGLMLSEAELRDQQEDNQLARQRALQQATDATNTFAADRIRIEEQRLDRIQDLRDKEVDNEQDRQQKIYDLNADTAQRLLDLEEDTQEKIDDIRRKSTQSREDVEREFSQDIEDILRDAGADEFLLQPGVLEQFRRVAQSPDSSILESFASDFGLDLSSDDFSEIRDLARTRLRDIDDIGIRDQRQIEDAQLRETRGIDDIHARAATQAQQIQQQAEANAAALQAALIPLLTEQRTGGVAEKQVAAADKQIEAAEKTETAAADLGTATEDLGTVATDLKDSDIPRAIDLVRESAEASLGISSAIGALPGLLEDSFEKIFDDLRQTIVDILQIEAGIQGGVGQYLLNTLIESEGRATGIVGETAAAALRSLGIDPEQFAPPSPVVEVPPELTETPVDPMLPNIQTVEDALNVNVTNPTDIYDPAEIERLRAEGFNNRVIGQMLRENAAAPMTPDMSTVPPETPIEPNALQTAGASGGGPIAVTVTNIGDLVSAISSGASPPNTPLELNVKIQNDLNLPDGAVQNIGDTIVRQRGQGRSLL